MTHVLGTIRAWHTTNFDVIVDAIEEDAPDPVPFDDTATIAGGIESGKFILFCARARVLYHGREIAADYLGHCVYKKLADFQDHRQCAAETRRLRAAGSDAVCGSYFASMVREVIGEARKEFSSIRLRRVET